MAVRVKAAGKKRKEKKVQLQCTLHYGAYKILEELAAEDFCKKCDVVRQLILDERRRRDRMRMDTIALNVPAQGGRSSKKEVTRRLIGAESSHGDAPVRTPAVVGAPPQLKENERERSVTSPGAGEDCYAELGVPVEWERGRIKGHSHIQLLLCTPSGEKALDAPETVPNTGRYEWHTTGCASGEYYITIQTTEGEFLGRSEVFNLKKPPYLKR